MRGCDAQWRQVGDHVRGADARQPRHLVIDPRRERGHERPRACERGGVVARQAVDLHHAGVARDRFERDARPDGAGHQPRRHFGADDDSGVGLPIDQRIDDLDRP